uniref:Uncharacterized protein n=1 Tax=Anguilla anguilla TaxID=7936 RepID=A0A0E9R4P4_ANGAN
MGMAHVLYPWRGRWKLEVRRNCPMGHI